ncbi:MAG: BatD family protein [bacterium]
MKVYFSYQQMLCRFLQSVAVLILGFISLIAPQAALATEINFTVNQNPAVLGDQIVLTFRAQQRPDGDPDFSPLNPFLDLQGTSQSHSTQIINGNVRQQITWSVRAYPKSVGKYELPAIAFGNDKSNPLTLEVVRSTQQLPNNGQGQNTANTVPDIFVEAEIEPKAGYVQQQFIYVQRLYYSQRFANNATLSTPQLKSGKVDIEPLTGNGLNDKRFNEQRDGKNYQVIERRFAIFPVQSGTITFAPTFFEGRLQNTTQGSHNFYDPFASNSGKTVRRYSPELTVEVKPQNVAYQGQYWLPAKSVDIQAVWSSSPTQLATGEPVTLTVKTTAEGLRAEQLPELSLNLPDSIKFYRDKTQLNNENTRTGVTGTREEHIILVPSQAGKFTLPDISLAWWNSTENKAATAVLEAQSLTVTGEAATLNPTQSPNTNDPNQTAIGSEQNTSSTVQQSMTEPLQAQSTNTFMADNLNIWFYLSLLLFILLTISLYLLWRQSALVSIPTKEREKLPKTQVLPPRSHVEKAIKQACQRQQAKQLRNAVLDWGSVVLNIREKSLPAIATQLHDKTLSDQLLQLNRVLYANEAIDYHFADVCQRLLGYQHPTNHAKPSRAEMGSFKGLYPQ